MDFLSKLLQGISFVPAIVTAVEKLFAGRSGGEKKNAAMSFLETALSITDAVTNRQIVDEVKFKEGLGQIVSGVVECLNASSWANAHSEVVTAATRPLRPNSPTSFLPTP